MNRQEERKCNQHPHSITEDREIMSLRISVLLETLTFITRNFFLQGMTTVAL